MNRTLLLFISVLALASGASAGPVVLFNNLGGSITGGAPIAAAGPLYKSFSTGASEFSVDDIVLELVTGSTTGSIDVAVYSDNGGSPGALFDDVDTLPGTFLHPAPFPTDVAFGTPFDLAANTNWWLGLSSTDDPGATWVLTGQAFMMEISGNNVAPTPEPGTWLLLAAGLGVLTMIGFRRRRSKTV